LTRHALSERGFQPKGFVGFSIFYLKEPMNWNYAIAFALIAAGAYFVFRGVLNRPARERPPTACVICGATASAWGRRANENPAHTMSPAAERGSEIPREDLGLGAGRYARGLL